VPEGWKKRGYFEGKDVKDVTVEASTKWRIQSAEGQEGLCQPRAARVPFIGTAGGKVIAGSTRE